MLLQVHHKTLFSYGAQARDNVNQLWMHPRRSPRQKVHQALVQVLPATRLYGYPDFFGNTVHFFEIRPPHDTLQIELNALIETRTIYPYDELPYGTDIRKLRDDDILEHYHEMLTPSHFVELLPVTWREAIDRREQVAGHDLFQIACHLMQCLYEECSYDPSATDVTTTSSQFAQTKAGVCQDYAHLLIAWLRSLKIPARYVSGYLYDPGHDHCLRGAQASHAWVDVFLPGKGWVGLDPTNNKVVNEQYIVLAVGRDYEDVAPVKGTFYGGGTRREMEVAVKITEASLPQLG